MLHCFVDHTYLINHIIFYLYYSLLKHNHKKSSIYQSLLKDLVSLRRGYPPLIGLLANHPETYIINQFYLSYCRRLDEEEHEKADP